MNTYVILLCFILLLVVALVWLIMRQQALVSKSKALEKKYKDALAQNNLDKLGLIESTLNPHLFKNILNSIQSHAYQTYFALDKVSSVLNYILYDGRATVSPREEIEFARNLIEINKIKVSPLFQLNIKTNVDEADQFFDKKILAPLVTIDLIENAFKHADLQSPDAFINVTFGFSAGIFTLAVANKISTREPLRKDRGGLGSVKYEERLTLLYGDRFKVERSRAEGIYLAYLKIDLNGHET